MLSITLCAAAILFGFVAQAEAQGDITYQTFGRIADSTYHCLIRRQDVFGTTISAGSIISRKHIITAANVVQQDGTFAVGVGSSRREHLLYYEVDRRFVHPYFMYVDKRFAIGVLELKHSLTFNSFIQPVALPPVGAHGPLWQEQGHVTSLEVDTGILKTAYQRINNDTYEMGEDSKIWGEYEDFNRQEDCAFIASGAGLIVRHFGVDTIMGLAIWGGSCATTTPIEYARVTKGVEWLRSQFGI